MAHRVKFLTVALDHDLIEDDAERLILAIRLLRGVLNVAANVADGSGWVSEERGRAWASERQVTASSR